MIGIIKYLTIEQLSQYQDHLIISPSAFKEAQAKANMRGREQGRADERAMAIDECIAEINRLNLEIAYPHTICNILEQLKEQNNDSKRIS